MENLVKQGWKVIREWRNKWGNHWVLLTPEGRIWSGVDNVRNKSKAWRRLLATVPANTACTGRLCTHPEKRVIGGIPYCKVCGEQLD